MHITFLDAANLPDRVVSQDSILQKNSQLGVENYLQEVNFEGDTPPFGLAKLLHRAE